ncbi:hypothetical protein CC80DRAFT_508398 [Byssothecium circinans]|uniref:Uncharacterized protein n=1 Tax=Byssothecium circinans TaxID=147558 RepID=A0A6A5TGS7_9PLEO|nr:hypothetical protein CC80DRAFT_508398 [Byssothecium circinans]
MPLEIAPAPLHPTPLFPASTCILLLARTLDDEGQLSQLVGHDLISSIAQVYAQIKERVAYQKAIEDLRDTVDNLSRKEREIKKGGVYGEHLLDSRSVEDLFKGMDDERLVDARDDPEDPCLLAQVPRGEVAVVVERGMKRVFAVDGWGRVYAVVDKEE